MVLSLGHSLKKVGLRQTRYGSNTIDADATILLKDEQIKVGYLPHYLCKDLKNLLNFIDRDKVKFTVLKVNSDAPVQFRVLCEMNAVWPDSFQPFSDDDFRIL